jgi:hypothetical protein
MLLWGLKGWGFNVPDFLLLLVCEFLLFGGALCRFLCCFGLHIFYQFKKKSKLLSHCIPNLKK